MSNILENIHRTVGGYDNFMFTTTGIPVPINLNWKRIAFNISGGADSAVLCYMMCKYIVENKLDVEIHTISHIRCWKTRPWQRDIRLNVIQKLISYFPSLKFVQHENYIPPEIEMGSVGAIIPRGDQMKSGDQLEVSSYSMYLSHIYDLDVVYCSTTSNPEILKNRGGDPGRDRNVNNINYDVLVYKSGKTSLITPFAYTTKDMVIKSYFDLNIEELLHTTRSCEGEGAGLFTALHEEFTEMVEHKYNDAYLFYKKNDYVPECGKCFWCLEKDWAIKRALE